MPDQLLRSGVIAAGVRVRVSYVSPELIEFGRVRAISADTLWIATDGGVDLALPASKLLGIDISAGKSRARSARLGAYLGLLGGAVVGLALAAPSHHDVNRVLAMIVGSLSF